MVKCEIGQFKVWRVIISFYKGLKRILLRSTNRPFSHWFLPKPLSPLFILTVLFLLLYISLFGLSLFLLQEVSDEVFDLVERKRKENLAYKRSFFVRMVSDPKLYNPKIAKALPGSRRHGSHVADEEDELESCPENGVEVNTPLWVDRAKPCQEVTILPWCNRRTVATMTVAVSTMYAGRLSIMFKLSRGHHYSLCVSTSSFALVSDH